MRDTLPVTTVVQNANSPELDSDTPFASRATEPAPLSPDELKMLLDADLDMPEVDYDALFQQIMVRVDQEVPTCMPIREEPQAGPTKPEQRSLPEPMTPKPMPTPRARRSSSPREVDAIPVVAMAIAAAHLGVRARAAPFGRLIAAAAVVVIGLLGRTAHKSDRDAVRHRVESVAPATTAYCVFASTSKYECRTDAAAGAHPSDPRRTVVFLRTEDPEAPRVKVAPGVLKARGV